jgi:hypothetical protein
MDPDVCLREAREIAERVQKAYDDPDGNGVDQDDANQLAAHVVALDDWLRKGGFLPAAWKPGGPK